jgi:hypothetical protein
LQGGKGFLRFLSRLFPVLAVLAFAYPDKAYFGPCGYDEILFVLFVKAAYFRFFRFGDAALRFFLMKQLGKILGFQFLKAVLFDRVFRCVPGFFKQEFFRYRISCSTSLKFFSPYCRRLLS